MSSGWWLGWTCLLGLGEMGQSSANLIRTGLTGSTDGRLMTPSMATRRASGSESRYASTVFALLCMVE